MSAGEKLPRTWTAEEIQAWVRGRVSDLTPEETAIVTKHVERLLLALREAQAMDLSPNLASAVLGAFIFIITDLFTTEGVDGLVSHGIESEDARVLVGALWEAGCFRGTVLGKVIRGLADRLREVRQQRGGGRHAN